MFILFTPILLAELRDQNIHSARGFCNTSFLAHRLHFCSVSVVCSSKVMSCFDLAGKHEAYVHEVAMYESILIQHLIKTANDAERQDIRLLKKLIS